MTWAYTSIKIAIAYDSIMEFKLYECDKNAKNDFISELNLPKHK